MMFVGCYLGWETVLLVFMLIQLITACVSRNINSALHVPFMLSVRIFFIIVATKFWKGLKAAGGDVQVAPEDPNEPTTLETNASLLQSRMNPITLDNLTVSIIRLLSICNLVNCVHF